MQILSWNLNGLEARGTEARVEAALQDILLGARIEAIMAGKAPSAPPDVILLQEVTRTSFHAPLKPHLRKAGFELFPSSPPDRSYFELLAVRAPWTVEGYAAEPLWKTQYGRWLHTLELSGPGGKWRVLTAHMDSGPERETKRIRRAQTTDIADRLEGLAVFAGDTNLRDDEVEGLELRDAWTLAGADPKTRFTWEGQRRRARFDRAWVSEATRVEEFGLVGRTPVAGLGEPPSDHLGLRLRLGAATK